MEEFLGSSWREVFWGSLGQFGAEKGVFWDLGVALQGDVIYTLGTKEGEVMKKEIVEKVERVGEVKELGERMDLIHFRSYLDLFLEDSAGALAGNPGGLAWTHEWRRGEERIRIFLMREEGGSVEILGEEVGAGADYLVAEGEGRFWEIPKEEARVAGILPLREEWVSSRFFRSVRGKKGWSDVEGSLRWRAKRLEGKEVEEISPESLRIFQLWKEGEGYRRIGEMYGVGPNAIRTRIDRVLRSAEGGLRDMRDGDLRIRGRKVWDGVRREWMKDIEWEDFSLWMSGMGYGGVANVRGGITPMGVKVRVKKVVERLEREGR